MNTKTMVKLQRVDIRWRNKNSFTSRANIAIDIEDCGLTKR